MNKVLSRALYLGICLLPWRLRRHALQQCYGYRIHPSARIGWSWIRPAQLVMEKNSSIGNYNRCTGVALVEMHEGAHIGNSNRIFGPRIGSTTDYEHRDRFPALRMGAFADITECHIIDCTDTVHIGRGSLIAGHGTQFLSHSMDLKRARQDCEPITIGDACFVATGSIVLKGAVLPDRSVLGPGSVLRKQNVGEAGLYWGVPAVRVGDTTHYALWFDLHAESPAVTNPDVADCG